MTLFSEFCISVLETGFPFCINSMYVSVCFTLNPCPSDLAKQTEAL